MRDSSPAHASGTRPDASAHNGHHNNNSNGPGRRRRAAHNRLPAVMEHVVRYSLDGPSRLAADAGVSHAALSRLINGHTSPSYRLVCALTAAIERHLGKQIDPRELVSVDGSYRTPSACELSDCDGCLPTHFYNKNNEIKPEYRGIKPGDWSVTPERRSEDKEVV